MSAVRLGITSPQEEEIFRLKRVIEKLERHLMGTNEKLAITRNRVRTAPSVPSRNLQLKRSYSMVREQHSIRKILIEYKKKLQDLETMKQQNEVQSQERMKNNKLHELFKTYDLQPLIPHTKTGIPPKKRKIIEEEKSDVVAKPIQITIHNGAWKNVIKTTAVVKNHNFQPVVTKPIQSERAPNTKLHELLNTDKPLKTNVNAKICKIVEKPKQPIIVKDVKQTVININSQSVALECLKALQEYAMLNENYRAIGLLTSVEKSFINPPEAADFEYDLMNMNKDMH